MSKLSKSIGSGLGVAILAMVVEASAVCPVIGVAGTTFYAEHKANQVCVPANAQAGNHLTYDSIGGVYNNLTGSSTQSICDLPGIAGHSVKKVAAIVRKMNQGTSDQATNCTLRVYRDFANVVYSDAPGATSCDTAMQVTLPANETFDGANVRCYLNPKVGSSTASIDSVAEAYWVN
jgi:hypothetical protein